MSAPAPSFEQLRALAEKANGTTEIQPYLEYQIATANPSVVLGLLDRIALLESVARERDALNADERVERAAREWEARPRTCVAGMKEAREYAATWAYDHASYLIARAARVLADAEREART